MKLVILCICLTLVHFGYGLQCYKCDKGQCDSITDKSKFPVTSCGAVAAGKAACLLHRYKDKMTGKVETVRKCIITETDPNGKPVHKCNAQDGEEVECNVCQTDLCNSATSSVSYTFFTFMGLLAAYIVPKYLL